MQKKKKSWYERNYYSQLFYSFYNTLNYLTNTNPKSVTAKESDPMANPGKHSHLKTFISAPLANNNHRAWAVIDFIEIQRISTLIFSLNYVWDLKLSSLMNKIIFYSILLINTIELNLGNVELDLVKHFDD